MLWCTIMFVICRSASVPLPLSVAPSLSPFDVVAPWHCPPCCARAGGAGGVMGRHRCIHVAGGPRKVQSLDRDDSRTGRSGNPIRTQGGMFENVPERPLRTFWKGQRDAGLSPSETPNISNGSLSWFIFWQLGLLRYQSGKVRKPQRKNTSMEIKHVYDQLSANSPKLNWNF